jgi:protein-S-isoprenylcysteine O-methyltransferase Ste14
MPGTMKPSALFVTVVPVVAIAALLLTQTPSRWHPVRIVGLLLLIPSVILLTLARIQLGNAFSVTPQATSLVTQGLYSRIRNPIYVFATFALAGLILYLNRPYFLLLLIPIIFLQIFRARRESQVLEERFGYAYRQYRAHTWF